MVENIEVFIQSSIRIKGKEGVIYMDPFKMREEPHNADYVFVTHDHYDHFSPEDIAKVAGPDTVLVVPEKMKGTAKEVESLVAAIVTVAPGEKKEIGGLSVETVPSYNVSKAFHPKNAEWVGYILTVDGQRIYVAGDTDATEEAKAVSCDIALIPIGGTYTMDAAQAAGLINAIRPAVAIPTHYGSIVGKKEDAGIFAAKVDPSIKVGIKLP